jgi:hypothetical protein
MATGVRFAWARLERERADAFGVPSSATELVVLILPALLALRGTGARRCERSTRVGLHIRHRKGSANAGRGAPRFVREAIGRALEDSSLRPQRRIWITPCSAQLILGGLACRQVRN